ncbi:MAG: GNAT family N-acetyltransferase [Microcoleaceae cyanobacterium]
MNPRTLPANFEVRAATISDLRRLAKLLAQSFHRSDNLLGLFHPLLHLMIYEDLRQRFTAGSRHYTCLVVILHPSTHPEQNPVHRPGLIVGTVELGLRSRYPWQVSSLRKYLYISNLAVHPQFRRQGIAQDLLQRCEVVARDWGFSALYLHVLENNDQAKQLYTKLGYRLGSIDWSWNSLLLGQPRQMFLHKQF